MQAPHKHSYLQKDSSGIDARIINRCVDLACRRPTIDGGDCEPPLNRLTSEQPCIPLENFDFTRRPLAFGILAMPKLRKELLSKNSEVVAQAVSTCLDLVHDPERAYEAIKLKVPDGLVDLLGNTNAAIRERTCMLLTSLANAADGKEAIVKNRAMLVSLSKLVYDGEPAVRMKVAKCLEALSTFWLAADELVDFGFIPILVDRVIKDDDIIAIVHLETLHNLMYGDDGINSALGADAFRPFLGLLSSRNFDLQTGGLRCLEKLLGTAAGKELATSSDVLPELSRLLHHERPDVYGNAAAVIMFATIDVEGAVRATRIENLPERLLVICHDDHNVPAKMFALNALANVSQHPTMRKYLTENYRPQIQSIKVDGDEELKRYKNFLLTGVNWVSYLN